MYIFLNHYSGIMHYRKCSKDQKGNELLLFQWGKLDNSLILVYNETRHLGTNRFSCEKKHKNSGYVRMREIKKGARGINHAGRNEKKKFNCTGTSDGNDEYCSFTGNYRNGSRNKEHRITVK